MASIFMDKEGHLAEVAVVPMGLLTYYLDQYPTASNQIAADTMLTMLRSNGEKIFNLAAGCSKARHSA